MREYLIRKDCSLVPKLENKEGEIHLSKKLYNKILSTKQSTDRPPVFMFGADKEGTVVEMINLQMGWEGCENMPDIPSSSILKGRLTLIKKGLIAVGIGRAGYSFDSFGCSYDRGSSVREAGKLGLWVLSYNSGEGYFSKCFYIEKRRSRKYLPISVAL